MNFLETSEIIKIVMRVNRHQVQNGNMDKLKKTIPYKWRVQSFSKNKAKAQCVAYIDARDVMNLLDEVVGAEKWQSDFKEVAGRVFSGIGIKCGDEWVWKWDTGSESNIEKEKGDRKSVV